MDHLPEEFRVAILRNLGNNADAFFSSLGETPPVSIRINPHKAIPLKHTEPVPWSRYGRYLSERPRFTLDPLFHAGSYYVQEPSSMFLEQALTQVVSLDNPINILDISAAPGGKSTHILSLIGDKALLVSNEVIRTRASILTENLVKWGYPNQVITRNDPKEFSHLEGFFDVIVVDAPCSGEGLFRKDPQAVREWSAQHVSLCSARQQRILHNVWPSLKQGGILFYCTCTYNEIENEGTLEQFHQQHDLEFIRLNTDPAWGIAETNHPAVIGYRFFPHKVRGEGFFMSVMRKTEAPDSIRTKAKKVWENPSARIVDQLKTWIDTPEAYSFIAEKDQVRLIPRATAEHIQFLMHHLRVLNAGTEMVTIKHGKLIPEHAFALSTIIRKDQFNLLPLNEEDALRYLRKETISSNNIEKGYALVTFKDIPLGWANVLPDRINNLYPSDWRIRMKGD